MDKRPPTIGKMFDRIALHYDSVNTILSLSIDRVWRKTAITALGIRPGDAVLDIASGTGDMAVLTLQQHDCRVTGIDLSRQMLVRALIKARDHNQETRFRVLQGDALVMPFPDGTFHRAMTSFGIRNVHDISNFLKEVRRVLNPGGRFAILEFSMPGFLPFRWIYTAYLNWLLPFFGGLISWDFASYRYLRDSIKDFPEPHVLEQMIERQHFRVVLSRPLSMGILHLYVLEKTS
jgi:demethylmenaquinone methyltransferase / 2-methoxy-6-polyprenyl-1,4-benzoquinol methylase